MCPGVLSRYESNGLSSAYEAHNLFTEAPLPLKKRVGGLRGSGGVTLPLKVVLWGHLRENACRTPP